MKKQDILKFFISVAIIILFSGKNCSQTEKDSVVVKNKYGIRIGLDFSKQIRMLTEDYKGLSLYGDVKIKERLFIVSELGSDEKELRELLKKKGLNKYFKGNIFGSPRSKQEIIKQESKTRHRKRWPKNFSNTRF